VCPFFLRHADGGQGVCGFAGLADGDQDVPLPDDRVAVAELTGVFDLDRDAGKVLEHVFGDQAGVPTGSTGDDDQALGFRPHVLVVVDARHADGTVTEAQPAPQAVCDGAGLFVDFLEHEMLIPALFDGFHGHLQFRDDRGDLVVLDGADFEAIRKRNPGDLLIFQVHHVLRVFDDGGRIGRHVEFTISDADDEGAGFARKDHFPWTGHIHHGDGIGTDHFVQRDACGLEQVEVVAVLEDLLDEVHQDLSVGIAVERVTARSEGLF